MARRVRHTHRVGYTRLNAREVSKIVEIAWAEHTGLGGDLGTYKDDALCDCVLAALRRVVPAHIGELSNRRITRLFGEAVAYAEGVVDAPSRAEQGGGEDS